MPDGPLYPADPDRRAAGSAPRPHASLHGSGQPCGTPLDELLSAIGRLEADFKLRWDAAQLGVPG